MNYYYSGKFSEQDELSHEFLDKLSVWRNKTEFKVDDQKGNLFNLWPLEWYFIG